LAKPGSLQPVDSSQTSSASSSLPTTSSRADAALAVPFSGQFDTVVTNSLLILDQNTFEVLHSLQFQPNEFALSIASMSFEGDASTYYVVGCAIVLDDEPEPKQGRLIVLKYNSGENKLTQVCEKEIRGAPYCLKSYNGKLLSSVANALKLYEFRDNELHLLASHSDNVFIVHLKCKNDFILIGDMMKSCAVLTYRADTNTFETVARDYTPIWLCSMEVVDDDNFLMSDSFFNIISIRKDR
jgi:DNA damage-binding protein 1